ncbi:MAG: glucose-6-phosphate dehydrogenase, partial [Lentisphaeria bacterium]|nr:glucose-6-phosphate dehydrogenase [Lentisphaeria bacterium]
ESMPEAYERLLLDCMLGDQTLFLRSDTVRLAWNYLQPALKAKEKIKPIPYPAGSTPEQVERLLKKQTAGCIP